MRIKLKQEDYKKIAIIVDKYREIETSLTEVQVELEKLDKEKDRLLSSLDSVRKEEEIFFKEIEKIHGEGKLDLLTFEYVTKK